MSSINKLDRNGNTPLMIAAAKGNLDEVIKLIEQGANPNIQDDCRMTALSRARNLGHEKVEQYLESIMPKAAEVPETINHIDKERAKEALINESMNKIIITTSYQVANREVEQEIDIISAEVVYGMNIFKDLFSAVRDIVGGRSNATQNILKDAKKEAFNELKREAVELGADAVIAVDLEYQEISGGGKSMLLFSVNGTAVKLKENDVLKPVGEEIQL